MDSIMGTKKKKKVVKKTELVQIRIDVAKPGGKKYTHLDWNELLKSHGKEKDSDSAHRFYDEDTLNLHKRLGELKTKSGKAPRVDLDYLLQMTRNAGYDMEDDFIDDSEALDEMSFPSKKGGFYVGKGDLKAVDEGEEEEEESEEEEEEVQKKPRKRKEKTAEAAQESTSDSDESEPVRMTGVPPMARLTGAPPTKKLHKRPSPSTPTQRKESTPLKGAEKKKSSETSNSSSDDEPPPKKKAVEASPVKKTSDMIPAAKKTFDTVPAPKKAVEPVPTPSTSSSTSSEVSSVTSGAASLAVSSPVKPKAVEVAVPSKSTVKQDEIVKKSFLQTAAPTPSVATTPKPPSTQSPSVPSVSATSSSSSGSVTPSPLKGSNVSAAVTKLFASLIKKGQQFKSKPGSVLDQETIAEILYVQKIMMGHKLENINIPNMSTFVAAQFGLTVSELNRFLVPKPVQIKKEPSDTLDWKLTAADLPSMSEAERGSMTTIVKSWKGTKQIPDSIITNWLKEINERKLNVDQARTKFFDLIRFLPDLDKALVPDTSQDLPKHERSRKPRMFLPQWVYLSRKYIEMILPTLKRPSTEGLAMKQSIASNTLKDAVKKQQASFLAKKDKPADAVYQFQFTEPVLASVSAYLDELVDYSLSIGKLDYVVMGIDSLHPSLDNKLPLVQFYIELCRRLQKLSFLTVEEPIKTRLADGRENISKHQVVQNPKYVIKWPEGKEPSMRGLAKVQITAYDTSVLAGHKPQQSPSVVRTSSSKLSSSVSTPSTSTATSSSSKPSTTSQSAANSNNEERRAMNSIVQIYMGKYLLAHGNSPASICDPTVAPMSDEQLIVMVTAVNALGNQMMNQMVMLKNILAHCGQQRMAQAISKKTNEEMQVLTTKHYQILFEYFSKYEKALDQKKLKEKDLEEKERKKMEERLKKEREKMMEKEKKEQEKREEKERKEKEKREERERKEKEIREMIERRKKEEEDRRKAQEKLVRQMEDQRRKQEAEKAVEKEMERRARMETEAESALQGLEEDNLMDDVDFVAEQQNREDEERKIAEAQRAVERENQIKMMRAHKVKQEIPTHETVIPIPDQMQIRQEPGMEQFRERRQEIEVQIQPSIPTPVHPTEVVPSIPAPNHHQTPQNAQRSQVPQDQRIPEPIHRFEQRQEVPSQSSQVNQALTNGMMFPRQTTPQNLSNDQRQTTQNLSQSQPEPRQEVQVAQQPVQIPQAMQADPNYQNHQHVIQRVEQRLPNIPQLSNEQMIPPVDLNHHQHTTVPHPVAPQFHNHQNGNVLHRVEDPSPQVQSHPVPFIKPEPTDPFDILSAAEEAAGLSSPIPPVPAPPQPSTPTRGGAFDKLASLRGRTMSADVRRMGESVEKAPPPPLSHFPQQNQQVFNGAAQTPTTPFSAPGTSQQQHFFPNQVVNPQEQMMIQQQQLQQQMQQQQLEQQRIQQQQIRMRQEEEQRRQQELRRQQQQQEQELRKQQEIRQQQELRRKQQEQEQQMRLRQQQEHQQRQMQMQMAQQQQRINNGMFFENGQNQGRRPPQGMSSQQNQLSQPGPSQQFPIPSYQSPSHHNPISNSSLMPTPLSNGSMVSQSPQFASHPSPMSQQFHTPPSVGMLNNSHQQQKIINSPVQPNQQHLQHFNYPPTQQHNNFQQQQHPQMHRQLSQQQLQMQQNMQQQQSHPMMRQMSHHQTNNYPPQH